MASTSQALIKVAEASKILDVSEATVSRWCDTGRLRSLRHPTSGHRLIKRALVEDLAAQIRQVTEP